MHGILPSPEPNHKLIMVCSPSVGLAISLGVCFLHTLIRCVEHRSMRVGFEVSVLGTT